MSTSTASAASTTLDPTIGLGLDDVYAAIAAGAVDRERSRTLAHDEVALLWERRFGALRLPVELGGAGASVRELFTELIALAAADSNITQALRVHFSFVEDQLLAGNDRLIAAIADGILVGNAITEPGSGAIDSYRTTLTRVGDEWRLNGEKFYSTGSLYADHILVAANRDDERVSVLVPATREGVKRVDDWRGFGQRLTASGTTLFTDVVVHDDEILGPGYGSAGPTYATAYLQLFQLAGLAGIAQRATDDLIEWVSARDRTFTHSVADRQRDDPLVQEIVGRLSATAFSARSNVLAVADLLDELLTTDPENAEAIARSSSRRVRRRHLSLRRCSRRRMSSSRWAGLRSLPKSLHWTVIGEMRERSPCTTRSTRSCVRLAITCSTEQSCPMPGVPACDTARPRRPTDGGADRARVDDHLGRSSQNRHRSAHSAHACDDSHRLALSVFQTTRQVCRIHPSGAQ